jgi:hypothetical protein
MQRTAAAIVLAIVVAAPVEAGLSRWHCLGADDFSQCHVETKCCEDPLCTDDELAFGDICSASCGGTCRAHTVFLYGNGYNRIVGHTLHEILSGNFAAGSDATVDITMVGPDTLSLEYQLVFGPGQGPPLQLPLPNVRVSVFRFAGDPTIFEGLAVFNVLELVSLGIIDHDDVLFSENLTGDGSVGAAEVDVAGIPAAEIVVIASGNGVVPSVCPFPPVPATGQWTIPLLLAAMFAAWVVVFRRKKGPHPG